MFIIVFINFGSNGNCYYVGNEMEVVLVDVGIFCWEILVCMKFGGFDSFWLCVIFVIYEYFDYICGVEVLFKKLDLFVYVIFVIYKSGKFFVWL